MKYGHLETVNIKLRTLAPVFIGSGQSCSKKEYILDTRKGLIYFPDLLQLIGLLKQRGLLPHYEAFLLDQRASDFLKFLQENQINETDYSKFIVYTINASEAVRDENFREVLTFIKDSSGQPFVPGSSLKGAIRTALAATILKAGDKDRNWRLVEQADDNIQPRRYLKRETDQLERRIFQKLDYRDRDGNLIANPVNDFMRGIRISDSSPIAFENLVLAGKYDRRPDGTFNSLPIYRECLAPGTEVVMTMTLDLPMLKKAGLNLDGIRDALHYFADQHYANFEQYFAESPDDADTTAREGVDVILGGGAGYVSKTILYNITDNREKSLRQAAKIMKKQFPVNHQHGKDEDNYKVSPHMLKTTLYQGCFYQMGRCELII